MARSRTAVRDLGIGGRDGTGVAGGAEVLAGVEAGGGDLPETADDPATPVRALGLRGVLDQRDAGVLTDLGELVERRELSEEVYGDDGGRRLA